MGHVVMSNHNLVFSRSNLLQVRPKAVRLYSQGSLTPPVFFGRHQLSVAKLFVGIPFIMIVLSRMRSLCAL